MDTLYVTGNGLRLKKRSNRIVVKREKEIVDEFPLMDLKRVVIVGNSQVSTDLMKLLAARGIELAFLSSSGRFTFRLVPETSASVHLRMAQHDRRRDMTYRVGLARAILAGKVNNQRGLLLRYRRNRPGIDIEKEIEALGERMAELRNHPTIEGLMGVEGSASRAYFSAYGRLLPDGFPFNGREYHPPPDAVNALLSFGYMLVFGEICGLLEASGFDVHLGFLHGMRHGRASLATDLMEEFRSPIVDRLVLHLTSRKVIRPVQFTPSEKGIRMDDAALKSYLANYEEFLTAEFKDTSTGRQTSYRRIMREQVGSLEKALLDERLYEPYVY